VFLGGPFGSTVLGTANVLCAATLARGARTIIECAACEPEIADLARMLTAMGARIERRRHAAHHRRRRRRTRHGCEHEVMPDRIEAGTFMCAAAITRGRVILENCPLDAMLAPIDALTHAGVSIRELPGSTDPMRAVCEVTADDHLRPGSR
jgi:UDP-N-acetylglucosamine 1-carboxyvinyltransferase